MREVSCFSLLHMAFKAFSFLQEPFISTGMELNLLSSLDLPVCRILQIRPCLEPCLRWEALSEGGVGGWGGHNSPPCPLLICQHQTPNSSFFCSSCLFSAAWRSACFIYSSLFREAFWAFHYIISPGFWLCSMGKETKYNSKLAWYENSQASADRKKEKWGNVVACMDFLNGDLHAFFYIQNLFPSTQFHKEYFCCQKYLSSPEKMKINYLRNLTKFLSPWQNQSISV